MKLFANAQSVTTLPIKYFSTKVPAGFPSPAEDAMEGELDLNSYIVSHPSSTFYVKVEGESMTGAGIFPGDLLVVDRSVEAKNNTVILAIINNEFTVKRIVHADDGKYYLQPENPTFQPIEITQDSGFQVWGVVTYVVHQPK
jgi:DNA polymerase V